MPKFEKKFVHFMWSDELEGKKCFVADSIGLLYSFVERNLKSYRYEIIGKGDGKYPFKINGPGNASMVFCYHDPWYDLKVAYEQGKTIQAHVGGNMWVNIEEPLWKDCAECYRIMPEELEEKPVTNRELAQWLAQGNGEYYEYDCDGWESHRYSEYRYEQDNLPVSNVMVRKWDDKEWHKPTIEYMGLRNVEKKRC